MLTYEHSVGGINKSLKAVPLINIYMQSIVRFGN